MSFLLRSLCILFIGFLGFHLQGCKRDADVKQLVQDASVIANSIPGFWRIPSKSREKETVQDSVLNDLTASAESPRLEGNGFLFVATHNAGGSEKQVHRPPVVEMLPLSPNTSFDYLYVRSWLDHRGPLPEPKLLVHFVIRDIQTGVLVRGSLYDGTTRIEPIPSNIWTGES